MTTSLVLQSNEFRNCHSALFELIVADILEQSPIKEDTNKLRQYSPISIQLYTLLEEMKLGIGLRAVKEGEEFC
uniref:Uncharacterized protein n=1 Tax=Vespula pensylvanica TaxID=30213 RepID=A0A834PBV3_VESPE|nr:hypothetical protein H0235_003294 [Vespula pensylvanica]